MKRVRVLTLALFLGDVISFVQRNYTGIDASGQRQPEP